MIIRLNDFIIDIMKSKKYFTENEYNKIKHINNDCVLNEEDDDNDYHRENKLKTDMQHYIFYFLLEYTKLIISDNNQKNKDINDHHIFSHAQN
jgi:hypothetical protein